MVIAIFVMLSWLCSKLPRVWIFCMKLAPSRAFVNRYLFMSLVQNIIKVVFLLELLMAHWSWEPSILHLPL
jgi:hypothetical protein